MPAGPFCLVQQLKTISEDLLSAAKEEGRKSGSFITNGDDIRKTAPLHRNEHARISSNGVIQRKDLMYLPADSALLAELIDGVALG